MIDRPLPSCVDVENAVLSACMLNVGLIPKCEGLLPEDFYSDDNRITFDIMREMFTQTGKIERLILMRNVRGKIAKAADEYIRDIENSLGNIAEVDIYIDEIKRTAACRKIILKAMQVIENVYSGKDISESIQDFSGDMDLFSPVKAVSAKDYAYDFLEAVEEAKKHNEPELKTGYSYLDSLLWGLRRGEIFTVGARPGVGKSVFLLSVAISLLKKGKKVIYFSTEMSIYEKWCRAMTILTDQAASNFRSGKFSPDEQSRISDMAEWLASQNNFVVVENAGLEISSVSFLVKRHRPDVVFLDYLGLFKMPTGERRDLAIDDFMSSLKILARQENVAVLLAAQLNRQIDHRQGGLPVLADLKDASAIEATSDVVGILYPDTKKASFTTEGVRPLKLNIKKNRNGRLGVVNMTMQGWKLKLLESDQGEDGNVTQ